MTDSRSPRFFRYACGGCLALFALAVLGIGSIALIGFRAARVDPDVVEERLDQPLEAPSSTAAGGGTADLGALARDTEGDLELAGSSSAVADGRIELDLSAGEFSLSPGAPGEPVRVDAEYDRARYELERTFDEGPDGWTYRIRFGSRGGLLRLLGSDRDAPRVRITVPPGVGFHLGGEVAMGQSEIDLTGLTVRDVDLVLRLGEHRLEWNAPSPAPMESLSVRASMGEIRIGGVGWASPRSIDLEHAMGELQVDLDGSWQRDAALRARFKMGPLQIDLPRDVRVVVDQARVDMGESRVDALREGDAPAGAPTLTLDLSGKMGELTVRR